MFREVVVTETEAAPVLTEHKEVKTTSSQLKVRDQEKQHLGKSLKVIKEEDVIETKVGRGTFEGGGQDIFELRPEECK